MTTEEAIHANAEMVVEQVQPIAGFEFGYDEESVKWLDGYINRCRRGASMDIERLVDIFGSYLGEAIIRCYGGHWSPHEGDLGVELDEGQFAFPFAKVRKHFLNGEEDSIYSFFTLLPVVMDRHRLAASRATGLEAITQGYAISTSPEEMARELQTRIQADIDHFQGVLPERFAIAWRSYLAGLLEWGVLPIALHHQCWAMLPPIENDPVSDILSGRHGD